MLHGSGELVAGEEIEGTARVVRTVDDVLRVLEDPALGDVIIVTDSASATELVPLLPEIGGVVCSAGGRTSHLAVVARDLGFTCIMGAAVSPAELDGQRLRLCRDGQVVAAE